VLKTLPSESVDCIITSPPYFGLRDYGMSAQIGLEETPELYVAKLVDLFSESRRVLKDEGTLWLNLGDSYSNDKVGNTETNKNIRVVSNSFKKPDSGLPHKNLIGIPWRVAFALQADGWYLRQDIIWHKPNPMPESVTDRCTKNHEYIFLLSKRPHYYYDNEAIKEKAIYGGSDERAERQNLDSKRQPTEMMNGIRKRDKRAGEGRIGYGGKRNGETGNGQESFVSIPEMKNKRSVWTVNTKPYDEAHFATYPEALIEPMVLAGCPKNGIILDPFMGAGTTGLVAKKLGRQYLGIELNPKYIKIAEERIAGQTPPLF
jgi:DNA modification methylase